jgi:two-component system alkaline phosphatase synthesis response regulator PhoP
MPAELPKANILVVEDEENFQEALKLNLEMEGYEVTCASDGAIALEILENAYFDLIILDVMMPEIDGIAVAETVRLQNNDVPILMLSAKSSSADRVLGLKKGADDYLVKPFNLEELLLRIKKLIEKNTRLHQQPSSGSSFSFGGNVIDFKAQTGFTHRGETIALTKKESMLIKLLVDNKNEVVSRERILQTVWGYQVFPNTRTIDNFVLNFRKYFEVNPRQPVFFHSVRGVGYKFTS